MGVPFCSERLPLVFSFRTIAGNRFTMASLRKESDRGRTGWRLQFRQAGKRRSLWLGDISKRNADTMAFHIDALVEAFENKTRLESSTASWAAGVDGRIRATLVKWALIDCGPVRNADADRMLGPFLARYIEGRTDVSQATRDKYGHTKRFLVGMFGEDRSLQSITKADAKRWQRWLSEQPSRRDSEGNVLKTMADSTASKHVKRAKTMFAEAVDAKLIDESPLDAIKGGDEVNRDRDHFVDRITAAKVLEACPDAQWRLMFALARFGGFRRCELLALSWGDVLWDQDRIRNNSPKTGLRLVPIFPELKPYLGAAFDEAEPGQVRCVNRYHRAANLGTQLNRIIAKAGIVPWEKSWQNLRATRRTELQESFPDHVVNNWMGHSSRVAEKSYLQVTPDHWALGAEKETGSTPPAIGGVVGGDIGANSQALSTETAQKNPVNQATNGSETLGNVYVAPPRGLEPLTRRLTAACSTN